MVNELDNIFLICNECNLEKQEFQNGEVYLIKVNLPSDDNDFIRGNGEGCWALIKDEALEAYLNSEKFTKYKAILGNDSFYYPSLKYETEIIIEMRGEYRPIVPIEWLTENYGQAQKNKL